MKVFEAVAVVLDDGEETLFRFNIDNPAEGTDCLVDLAEDAEAMKMKVYQELFIEGYEPEEVVTVIVRPFRG